MGHPSQRTDSRCTPQSLVVPSVSPMVVPVQIRVTTPKTIKEKQSRREVKAVRIDFTEKKKNKKKTFAIGEETPV